MFDTKKNSNATQSREPKPPIQKQNIPKSQVTTKNTIQQSSKVENGNMRNNIDSKNFPKDLNDYLRKARTITHPIKGSKLIGKEENLKIYKYKQLTQKNGTTITLIFVGETGCGKSTLINGLLNYFLGVVKTYDFRYKIVIGENEGDQTKSQTQEISTYFINSPLYPGITFQFIDTPGFADTDNEKGNDNKKDDKIYTQFVEFFKKKFCEKNELLNAACFIIKSSSNRFNQYQKQILKEVTSIFASDIKDNFLIMFTFSDTCKPKAIQFLTEVDAFKERSEKEKNETDKKKKEKLKWYWSVTTSKYFEDLTEANESFKLAYDENIMEFIKFINKVMSLQPLDAALTKKNLELNEELKDTKNIIKTQILSNLLKKYEAINDIETKLNIAIEELTKKQNEFKAVEDALNKDTNEKSKLTNEINQNKQDLEKLQAKINEYDSSENTLRQELGNISQQINTLKSQKDNAKKEKDKLEASKNQAQKEINELKSKLEGNEAENKINNIEDLKKKLEEKQNYLNQINNDIQKFDKDKDKVEKELKKYNQEMESINKQVSDLKEKKTTIEKEQSKKETEQNNLKKQLNKFNTKNESIEQLNRLIEDLEKSKNETKEVEEKKFEQELTQCKERYLTCKICKNNCHQDCDCNWVLFWKDKDSWWCKKIAKNGKCTICPHEYEQHLRDNFYYKQVEKKVKKIVGLDESEKKEIDDKLNLIRAQIKQINELNNVKDTIIAQKKKIDSYNSSIDNTNSALYEVQGNINKINDYKESIERKKESKQTIESEVEKMEDNLNYITKQKTYKDTASKITQKTTEITNLEEQISSQNAQKKNKEDEIQNINLNKQSNNIKIGQLQNTNLNNQNRIKTLTDEINKKEIQKNKLFKEIIETYDKNKKKLERKTNDLKVQKEIIVNNCIYQLLRIQIIIDEIGKNVILVLIL